MRVYEVKTVEGEHCRVSEEEIRRAYACLCPEKRMAHDHGYLARALANIKELARWGREPETEKDLKEVLYERMPGFTVGEADLLYEIIEAAIGMHDNDEE